MERIFPSTRFLLEFQRIELGPGESCRVAFKIDISKLSFEDHICEFIFEPAISTGSYSVWIGPSAEAGLEGSFEWNWSWYGGLQTI